jgi:hypothetical protein
MPHILASKSLVPIVEGMLGEGIVTMWTWELFTSLHTTVKLQLLPYMKCSVSLGDLSCTVFSCDSLWFAHVAAMRGRLCWTQRWTAWAGGTDTTRQLPPSIFNMLPIGFFYIFCLCRPFCIFDRCLESNPESCCSKQARYQLSHQSP